MQNIASAFFSSKRRQKDWTSSLFSLFRKINEAGLLNFAMNNNGVLYLYWSHLDQCLSPWHSRLNAKYAASSITFSFRWFDARWKFFYSKRFFFFFLPLYNIYGCAVLLFFHRRSNAVRVGNLGTRTFDEICPSGYFYKKVSTCHLQFSEYFKIKCYHTCRGLYSFVLPLSSPKKTRTDAIQTLFTGWMCVPHSPPMARPVN